MPEDNRSIAELFSDALAQLSRLVRDEIQLARAEISNSVTQAGVGIGLLVGAGLVLMATFVVLLLALAAWFGQLGVSAPLARLLAALVGIALAVALGLAGKSRLSAENLKPKRTLDQLEQDAAAVKEQVK